jgi:hypothetical protein
MSEYEQARAQHKLATIEIQRLEHQVLEMQQMYDQLSATSNGVEIDAQTEVERMNLVEQFSAAIREREYWLDVRREAEQVVQREQERLVDGLRDDVANYEYQIARRQMPEEERAALMVRRDQAHQEMRRAQQELSHLGGW